MLVLKLLQTQIADMQAEGPLRNGISAHGKKKKKKNGALAPGPTINIRITWIHRNSKRWEYKSCAMVTTKNNSE